MSFVNFGLSQTLLSVLESSSIQTPTSVQIEVIPAVAQGRDVLVMAKTGAGKSLAYALPLLNLKFATQRGKRNCVLIVVPSRELVTQLGVMFRQFTQKMSGIKLVELTGGASLNPQLMQLRGGADFVIATPGRLLDVLANNGLDPRSITTVVLDEADRLLSVEFQDDTDEILNRVSSCQRLLFSATYSRSVNAKAKWLLKDPLIFKLSNVVTEIKQRVIQVDSQKRRAMLEHLMNTSLLSPILVFVADRKCADKLTNELVNIGYRAKSLHSGLSMAKRSLALLELKEGRVDVLVATDLAARGLDIPSLPLVINYDLPRSSDLYTHRIGRTGRAGKHGMAISLVSINDEAHMALIEKRLGLSLQREQVDGFLPTDKLQKSILVDGTGGIKGRRMSKKDKLRAAANNKVP